LDAEGNTETGVIAFSLRCGRNHRFDSWFRSTAAFDRVAADGLISCPACGSTAVEKALMAPNVRESRARADTAALPPETAADRPLSTPASQAEQALAELRRQIEATSEYVGMDFAREARDIHEGAAPQRLIHGEARSDEARRLIEDGVPVSPLPFYPGRKSN